MDARTEELLGLGEVRDRLAALCQSAQGRAHALALPVAADPNEVRARHAVTAEAIELRRLGLAVGAGARDVAAQVDNAQRGGTLEIASLDAIATTARVAAELAGSLGQHQEIAPRLAAVGQSIAAPLLERLVGLIESALDGHGGVRDSASADLASARRRLTEARAAAAQALRDAAQRFRSHLQEGFLTERGGRPVLAVKAGSRSAVAGIVHDRSATGHTVFVEPLEVVEANNQVRELEAVERIEVERVLAYLSAQVAEDAVPLDAATVALGEVDAVFAAAELSTRWHGCEVTIGDDIDLVAARHPLLDPATVVPVDLPLAGRRGLVVSGPNAGGKTVALKTLGLLALCHQLGLLPPASAARLPVFTQVFADIGDDQSIEQSLSTFSGHVRRLHAILEAAGRDSLVLLDEIAAGTDPAAGAALARALVQELVARGATVAVTTHFDELKGWASESDAVSNAAVGFDAERLAPTFTIRVGEPGASHAIEVAERLGLDPAVIAAARDLLGGARDGIEALLRDAAAARVAAESERDRALAERDEVARVLGDIERREAELAAQIARGRADATAARERARDEARAELADLRGELTALRGEIASARREERRRTAANDAARHASERDRRLGRADAMLRSADAMIQAEAPHKENDCAIAVGDSVVVGDLGVRGTVVALDGDTVVVQGPSARLTLTRSRVARDRRIAAATDDRPRSERRPAIAAVGQEIDVRGERAEVARSRVREHIDAAAMGGLPTVRVIHGRGTGVLRAAVGEELRRHPLVAAHALAGPDEGGDGATVVTLR